VLMINSVHSKPMRIAHRLLDIFVHGPRAGY
jgi:hypothetical protein